MKGFDGDGCLIERKLDVLSFTEEIFFDERDFVMVKELLCWMRHEKYFDENCPAPKIYKHTKLTYNLKSNSFFKP